MSKKEIAASQLCLQKSHNVLRFLHETLSEFDLCQYRTFRLKYGSIVSSIATVVKQMRQMRQLSRQNKWPKQYNSVEKWGSFLASVNRLPDQIIDLRG